MSLVLRPPVAWSLILRTGIWGVTWVAGGGLDMVASALGGGFKLSEGKAAIQLGRRIATWAQNKKGVLDEKRHV